MCYITINKTVLSFLLIGTVFQEGNVLFDNALNTFLIVLHVISYMAKDHSDNKKEKLLLPPHGLLFMISSKASFICMLPQTGYISCLVIKFMALPQNLF